MIAASNITICAKRQIPNKISDAVLSRLNQE
jgi:hypothetical protein